MGGINENILIICPNPKTDLWFKRNHMNLSAIMPLFQDFEERELEWEQREVELERIIAQMERTQAEIAGAATQVS